MAESNTISAADGEGAGVNNATAPDATSAAEELRADLALRRQSSSLLAEATAARDQAVAEADDLVRTAQELAERLVAEARERSDGLLTQARGESESLVGLAQAEAERLREGVAAERAQARAEAFATAAQEIDEIRARSERLVTDIERGLEGLDTMLAGAGAKVADIGRFAGELASAAAGLQDDAAEAEAEAQVDVPPAAPEPVASDAPDAPATPEPPAAPVVSPTSSPSSDPVDRHDEPPAADPVSPDLVKAEAMAGGRREPEEASSGEWDDVAVEGQVRLRAARMAGPEMGFGSVPLAEESTDREDTLVTARPLGWLFRGN